MEKKNVTVRHLTLGDGVPKICIPVTARSLTELEEQTEKLRKSPYDMIELRADFFEGDPIEELYALKECLPDAPILFTFRTKEEGGAREISLENYAVLCRRAAADSKRGKADFIDLEINRGEAFIKELCRELQTSGANVILSFHDFAGTPKEERLVGLFRRMQELGADVTKVAVMPHTERDVLTLLSAAVSMKESWADRPYIVMSMGRLGGISRLAGAFDGSAVTFAAAGATSAPGQMDAQLVSEALAALAGNN